MLTDRGQKYIIAMNDRLMFLLKTNNCRYLLSLHFTVSFKANEQASEDILTNQLVSLVIERFGSPLLVCHLHNLIRVFTMCVAKDTKRHQVNSKDSEKHVRMCELSLLGAHAIL